MTKSMTVKRAFLPLVLGAALVLARVASAGTAQPESPSTSLLFSRSIHIRGNTTYSDAQLHEVVRPAANLDDAAAAIAEHYSAHGYVSVKAHGTTAPGGGQPEIEIDEGGLFTLRSIDFVEVGADAKRDKLSDPTALRGIETVRPGGPFDRDRIIECIAVVRARYDAAGYGSANLVPVSTVDLDHHTVGLRIEIERGRVRRITAIDIVGVRDQTRVRQIVLVKVGDVFSYRKQEAAAQRLRIAGYRGAKVVAEDRKAGVGLVVTLEEEKP